MVAKHEKQFLPLGGENKTINWEINSVFWVKSSYKQKKELFFLPVAVFTVVVAWLLFVFCFGFCCFVWLLFVCLFACLFVVAVVQPVVLVFVFVEPIVLAFVVAVAHLSLVVFFLGGGLFWFWFCLPLCLFCFRCPPKAIFPAVSEICFPFRSQNPFLQNPSFLFVSFVPLVIFLLVTFFLHTLLLYLFVLFFFSSFLPFLLSCSLFPVFIPFQTSLLVWSWSVFLSFLPFVFWCFFCFVLALLVLVVGVVLKTKFFFWGGGSFPFLFCFFGGFKGQVRWNEGPPHSALNPPYVFVLLGFCLFLLFCLLKIQ